MWFQVTRTTQLHAACVVAIAAVVMASAARAQTATSPMWSPNGSTNSRFGSSVARAGDANRDGYDDLIVAAPNTMLKGFNLGYVRYYPGGPTGPSSEPAWQVPLWSTELMSVTVAGLGDVNGDSYADFAIGGPNGTSSACVVYTGGVAGPAHFLTIVEGDAGSGFGSGFAYAVCGADVDGDGYDDLVAGEPFQVGDGAVQGRVLVYRGGPSGPTDVFTFNLADTGALDYFGFSIGSVGDVNADGYDDLVVGSIGSSGIGGRVQLFAGSAIGPQPTTWSFTALGTGVGFPNTIAGAGDVNDDGYDDVLIGAPLEGNLGRVRLFLGSASGLTESVPSQINGVVLDGELGAAVASAGDVNGDGYADALIGAPGAGTGRAVIHLGSSTGLATAPAWNRFGTAINGSFGAAVASLDSDGNGFPDMLVGAPGANGGNGQAALFPSAGGTRIGAMDIQVVSVSDPFGLLAGAIAPGHAGTGYYAHGTAGGDLLPGTASARYPFLEAPHLVDLRIGGLDFRSDPLFPSVALEIMNTSSGQGGDSYVVRSVANRRLPNNVRVDSIEVRLQDPSGSALQSEHQNQRIPSLAGWPTARVVVSGSSPIQVAERFRLVGDLVALTPVLPPMPSGPVIALPRCFIVRAEVMSVSDPSHILQGAIAPAQVMTGQYVYNARTEDSNALPTLGEFHHTATGFGMEMDASGFDFRTDPQSVQFVVRLGDGTTQQGMPIDLYEIESVVNRPLHNGLIVDLMEWRLTDPTLMAVAGDTLPPGPPDPTRFSGNVLRLTGHHPNSGAGFEVDARGLSCVPCSEARAATSDVVDATRVRRLWTLASPNPFRGTTLLRYDPAVGAVRIEIFDVAGRRVRRLSPPVTGTAPGATWWDGNDDHGRAVAAGHYVYRVRAPAGTAHGKLVRVR